MGGLNLYGFGPNPLGWVDPLGWACWSTARKNYWKNEAKTATPGKYSMTNLLRMSEGKAPRIQIQVKYKNTLTNRIKNRVGQVRTVNVPLEIHHQHIPQRAGSNIANEFWNLTKATPWGHASMDGYRNLGWDLIKIVKTTATY